MKQIAIVLSFIFIPGQNKMFQFRITINANKKIEETNTISVSDDVRVI